VSPFSRKSRQSGSRYVSIRVKGLGFVVTKLGKFDHVLIITCKMAGIPPQERG
jgi:hypothetical protein